MQRETEIRPYTSRPTKRILDQSYRRSISNAMAIGEGGTWISETEVLDGEVFLGSGSKTGEKVLAVWSIL
jgi:hypothetical protein